MLASSSVAETVAGSCRFSPFVSLEAAFRFKDPTRSKARSRASQGSGLVGIRAFVLEATTENENHTGEVSIVGGTYLSYIDLDHPGHQNPFGR